MNQKQLTDRENYQKLVEERAPKSPVLPDCLRAFFTGGLICLIGQGVSELGEYVLLLEGEAIPAFTAIAMVFLGALLTGLGVYDKIYQFGGAGAAVPITGFSNSVVSPAMEYRREGLIMGTGAKMFTIAGPVLVYGIGGSVIAGLIWLMVR